MHADLVRKPDELEQKCDAPFRVVFDALRPLMHPPLPPRKRTGFGAGRRIPPVRRPAKAGEPSGRAGAV